MMAIAVIDEFLRPLRGPGFRDSVEIALWQWYSQNVRQLREGSPGTTVHGDV